MCRQDFGPTVGLHAIDISFFWIFNVPFQAPTRDHPFYGYSEKRDHPCYSYSEKRPQFSRLLRRASRYKGPILHTEKIVVQTSRVEKRAGDDYHPKDHSS